jgi:hypothetical protein
MRWRWKEEMITCFSSFGVEVAFEEVGGEERCVEFLALQCWLGDQSRSVLVRIPGKF